MKRMNFPLPARALAAALAATIGLAQPAFARGGEQDRARGHSQQEEGDAHRPKKAQEAVRHETGVRRDANFAPSRPDPRAVQVREREQAHEPSRDMSAQRRPEAMQRIQAQRALQERAQERNREQPRQAQLERIQREQAQRQRHVEQRNEAARRQADQRAVSPDRIAALKEARENAARQNASRERNDREARVSDQERQRRIELQQQRLTQYRRDTEVREAAERQRIAALQNARRTQQFRYQQAYWQRQRELRNGWYARGHSYTDDPFYYAPASYRYLRAGRWYDVNRYAADLLQQAIRMGYDQGYRAGEADRLDGWRYDYRSNYAYLDANFGYYGYYVDQADYNYYFRQSFRRGYQDGYARAYRYGRYDDGSYVILASVLRSILNLQPY